MIVKTFSAIVLGLSLSFSSFADFHHIFQKKDWMLKISKKLNLTDKQKNDITKISEENIQKISQYHEDFIKIQANINNDFTNNTMTEEKKSAYVDEELKIFKEIFHIKLQERMEIYQNLTPDQQKAFGEYVNNWLVNNAKSSNSK